MKRIVIVGGGASGMAAAIAAATAGAQVSVLEQNDRVGRKLLATGNGRCNFTNRVQEKRCYRSENRDFPWTVVGQFDEARTEAWFRELGICPKERNGGLYPYSDQGSAVLDALRWEMERLGVQVLPGMRVRRIEKKDGGFLLRAEVQSLPDQKGQGARPAADLRQDARPSRQDRKGHHGGGASAKRTEAKRTEEIRERVFRADAVILACGSRASQIAGSDGSGYELARELGHRIVPVVPALVQLRCAEPFYRSLAGIRVYGRITLSVDGRVTDADTGEIQLTDYGISGIPVFQVSRWASRGIREERTVTAVLDFLPDLERAACIGMLRERQAALADRELEPFLTGLFHKKLAQVLVRRAGLEPRRTAGSLSDEELGRLGSICKTFETQVTGANGFARAQVCAGGVDTEQVRPETMESRLVAGLYIAGELLDVDGICGGYNLQWAWSSGYLAGKGAACD